MREKQLNVIKKFKTLDPDSVNWRLGMARVYWHKGSLKALRYFREILNLKPSPVRKFLAMAGMGISYYMAKKFPQAEKWYLKALKLLNKLESKHPEVDKFGIFTCLMALYEAWHRPKEAIKYARKALSLYHSLPSRYRNNKRGKRRLQRIKKLLNKYDK